MQERPLSKPPDSVRGGKLIAGKYRIESLLGTGAMGTVWVATHATLGSKVAVKLVSQDFARSTETKSRFLAEAKAAAALRSRYVVQMFDSGVTEDGSPYIVMEYLNGESLEERISRLGRLSLEQTIRIIGQVAKGLQRAHASNIVHRDLKPANIFVAQTEDGEEVAKILDFGIAKMDHDDRDYKATATGVIMGTPLYMSPEQARGLRTVGPTSDVYSLGMVAYCALVGDVPFHAESFGDLVYMVCTQDLPPTHEAAPWLPPSLDGWFRRACHKDQTQRFQTPEEMYEALVVAANLGRASGLASLPDTAQGFAMPRGLTPPHGFMLDTGGRPVPPTGTANVGAGNVRSSRASGAHATLPFSEGASDDGAVVGEPGSSSSGDHARGANAGAADTPVVGGVVGAGSVGAGSARQGNSSEHGSGPRRAETALQRTLLDASQAGAAKVLGADSHAAIAGSAGRGGDWDQRANQTSDGGLVATDLPARSRSKMPLIGGIGLGLSILVGGIWWGGSSSESASPSSGAGSAGGVAASSVGSGSVGASSTVPSGVVAPAHVAPVEPKSGQGSGPLAGAEGPLKTASGSQSNQGEGEPAQQGLGDGPAPGASENAKDQRSPVAAKGKSKVGKRPPPANTGTGTTPASKGPPASEKPVDLGF